MKIYFIRHGKTKWNAEKRLQGQFGNSSLLPESYEELKAVRNYLRPVHFDKVFSSPKERAIDTAEHITDLPISPDMRLCEWNFGRLEGVQIEDAVAKYPDEMWASRNALDQFDGSSFGAETVASVLSRFESLASDCALYDTVLWVGHGASGTAGLRHLAGFPISELRAVGGLHNNTVTILEGQLGNFTIKVWNEAV